MPGHGNRASIHKSCSVLFAAVFRPSVTIAVMLVLSVAGKQQRGCGTELCTVRPKPWQVVQIATQKRARALALSRPQFCHLAEEGFGLQQGEQTGHLPCRACGRRDSCSPVPEPFSRPRQGSPD